MRLVKKQQIKVKFWIWGPRTVYYNMTCAQFFFFKNHSTLVCTYSLTTRTRCHRICKYFRQMKNFAKPFFRAHMVSRLKKSRKSCGTVPLAWITRVQIIFCQAAQGVWRQARNRQKSCKYNKIYINCNETLTKQFWQLGCLLLAEFLLVRQEQFCSMTGWIYPTHLAHQLIRLTG